MDLYMRENMTNFSDPNNNNESTKAAVISPQKNT